MTQQTQSKVKQGVKTDSNVPSTGTPGTEQQKPAIPDPSRLLDGAKTDDQTPQPESPPAQLAAVVQSIKEEHEQVLAADHRRLLHAKKAGDLLVEAKTLCKKNKEKWTPWVEENCGFAIRTAQAYMRVSDRWDELEEKAQGLAHLGLEQALKLLAQPKPKTQVQQAASKKTPAPAGSGKPAEKPESPPEPEAEETPPPAPAEPEVEEEVQDQPPSPPTGRKSPVEKSMADLARTRNWLSNVKSDLEKIGCTKEYAANLRKELEEIVKIASEILKAL